MTEMLDDVTDRKWRHQSNCRPRFSFSVQYMLLVYWNRSLVISVFWEVSSGRLRISTAKGRRKLEVKSQFDKFYHGFLLVFNTYYLYGMHRLKVAPIFTIVDYGGMSISTARGRLMPEVPSPVDRATTVFYSCFVGSYRLSSTVSTLLAFLFIAKNGGKTISAARGRAIPEVKSPFDSLTRFGIGRFCNFSAVFHLSKVIRLWDPS
jgi:hypothetical protein